MRYTVAIWWVASYPLLSQAPTHVEIELGCDNRVLKFFTTNCLTVTLQMCALKMSAHFDGGQVTVSSMCRHLKEGFTSVSAKLKNNLLPILNRKLKLRPVPSVCWLIESEFGTGQPNLFFISLYDLYRATQQDLLMQKLEKLVWKMFSKQPIINKFPEFSSVQFCQWRRNVLS